MNVHMNVIPIKSKARVVEKNRKKLTPKEKNTRTNFIVIIQKFFEIIKNLVVDSCINRRRKESWCCDEDIEDSLNERVRQLEKRGHDCEEI